MVAHDADSSRTGNKTVLTYEFDAPGNWITQVWSGCSPGTEAREYDLKPEEPSGPSRITL
jgi:hypothetical protein